ncbi:protein trichome birefringence-like 14 [Physcomitrium patens]|uniref:Uncharacterized protein n=1 Tax=Physcomitrium patens TaxID=3218 RepID=A0A2K1IHB3_PHYPA|nr:hypothetical protein PHYPA_029259 [Physcomitrium patens]
MEPYYNRRGTKDIGSVCGMTRGNQTMLLMLAMVASMAVVLLWESAPFSAFNNAQSQIPKSGGYAGKETLRVYDSPEKSIPKDVASDLTESDTTPDSMEEQEPQTLAQEDSSKEPSAAGSTIAEDDSSSVRNGSVAIDGNSFDTPARESEEESLAEKENDLVRSEIDAWSKVETPSPKKDDDWLMHNGTEKLTKSSETSVDAQQADGMVLDPASIGSPPTSSEETLLEPDGISQETNTDTSHNETSEKQCDYSVGKWVRDDTRPLYSGLECTLWLSPGFSCRLHDHPNKLMDRYRWQPAGCDMPPFNASRVLETLRNKVIAFVGDSLGRQQYQSIMCLLTRGRNDTAITDIGSTFGFYTPKGERKPNGFAHRFDATNTTIIFRWTVSLGEVHPLNVTDPLTRNALHLDRPEEFLRDHIDELDVVVLNTGHHWNGGKKKLNRFDYYYQGNPIDIAVPLAYNLTVHSIVQWVSERIKNTQTIAYYRSLSPRHFRNGDWNTGGTCDQIRFENEKQVQEGNRLDPNAESAIIGTGVDLLNITSLSFERGETHVSKYGGGVGGQDCLHWCLPGVPDTWNEILFADLARKFKSRESSTVA